MTPRTLLLGLLLLSIAGISATATKKKQHHYNDGDAVPFFANKIGPYSNPSETYGFYDVLRFCAPDVRNDHQHSHVSFGESMIGERRLATPYDVHFKEDKQVESLCMIHLDEQDIGRFKKAIDEYYYFEMEFDDLPLYGFVGAAIPTTKGGQPLQRYYYFAHLNFHFLYNGDQVIFGNITADLSRMQELKTTDVTFEVTYSVKWSPTSVTFNDRSSFTENHMTKKNLQIHWLSIMNSIILVLLLTGFLTIILLRILKNDFTRYALIEDEEEGSDLEDYGWKLVHGDVFRFPVGKTLLCALIGLGCQFLTVLGGLLLLAVVGVFYPNNPGTLYVAAIVLYALTSVLGGYVSAYYYKSFAGENWAWNILLVGTLYTVPSILVFSYVNTIAIIYNATAAVPVGTILTILAILILVGFPLNVFGGIAGRKAAKPFDAPCRVKNFMRSIPDVPFYRTLPFQMMISGFLPYSAIYTELRYLFESTWGHTSYQLFGILFLVAIILLIVTACITIALTYFQLSTEDYHWWWNSFLNGGSTGIFIYGYAIYWYKYSSAMSGALQSSFYFAYMLLVCFFFFIMLGTVGFFASLVFVKRIYRGLKID